MRKVVLVVLLVLFSSRLLAGGLYYYVDEKGVYHFSDTRQGDRFNKMIIWPSTGNQSIKTNLTINFDEYITQACYTYDVDADLVRAMIKVESNYNPNAVSNKGAQGLMQIMPTTAQQIRLIDPFHPRDNIFAGVGYFRALLDRYNGNERWALAAYNAGPGAVDKYGGVPPYTETINYVKRVMDLRNRYGGGDYKPDSRRYRSRVVIISERTTRKK
jgi:soluble lytic murein transglycosylase-like protein